MRRFDAKGVARDGGRNKAASIDDVARLAAVWRYTVSRAYTPGAGVAPAMRRKIEAAAAALGYLPNLIARSLSTQRSRVVAVARLENSFHAEMMQVLAAGLAEHGYRALVFAVDRRADSDPPMENILQYRADTVILLSVRLSSRFAEQCRAADVPVLLLNRHVDDLDVPAIFCANDHMAFAVMDVAHRKFGLEVGRQISIVGFDGSLPARD